jgi:hypothetical protein
MGGFISMIRRSGAHSKPTEKLLRQRVDNAQQDAARVLALKRGVVALAITSGTRRRLGAFAAVSPFSHWHAAFILSFVRLFFLNVYEPSAHWAVTLAVYVGVMATTNMLILMISSACGVHLYSTAFTCMFLLGLGSSDTTWPLRIPPDTSLLVVGVAIGLAQLRVTRKIVRLYA